MVIRREQANTLSENAVKVFEDQMAAHLNKCFPDWCRAVQEPGVRETIRYGVKQAAQYGITAQRDVCKYTDLMVVFGRDFDRNPGVPWASSILNDRALKDPTVKTEALYEAGKQHEKEATSSGRSG